MTGISPVVDPEEVQELAESADLKAILASNLQATRISLEAPARFSVATESQVAPGDGQVAYQLAVNCTIANSEDEPVAELSVTVQAHFQVASDKAFQEASFHAFGANATMMMWPYARQYLQDMSARIGLPALTIGILKPGDFRALDGESGTIGHD